MYVKYSSNNSGGGWWLTDKHWQDLEQAGWEVAWVKDQPKSHFGSLDKDGRWLGALAREATRRGLRLREAADEWERITGLSATSPGCPC